MNENFIKVNQNNLDVVVDLRYSSNNNFTKKKVSSMDSCFLHKVAYEHLCRSVEICKKIGFKLKIFDAYRPVYVQKKLWDFHPDPNFLSHPKKGSPHSRGVAIDLTLIREGEELDMGTDFDDFTERAFHLSKNVSFKSRKNRSLLLSIMILAGFDFYEKEWWHYQLFNPKKYPLIKGFQLL